MDKLVLKDGTKIDLVAGASLGALQIESESRETMLEIWKKADRRKSEIDPDRNVRRSDGGKI